MNRIIWLIGLVALLSGISFAAHSTASDPKNIREIFLTVPWPKGEKDSFAETMREKVGGPDHRQRLVDQVTSGNDKSIIDLANGYLKIDLGEGEYLVMTYFQKSDGNRLVVLQVADTNTPNLNAMTENYLFTLSGSSYKAETLSTYLPKFELIDFWGIAPLPRPALQKMLSDPFYIEWPRKGTVATVIFDEPDFDVESKETIELEKSMKKRQFDRMELVWDKQGNIFKKGRKTKDKN